MINDKDNAVVLDLIIVGATILVGLMLFYFKIPPENKDIANILFGSLVTLCGTIINYHRGSSHGSKVKNDIITDMKK
jgi:fatty-acid desaturase